MAVGAARGAGGPFKIGEVPGEGLAQSGIEGLRGRPTELNRYLREIRRVAPVVSRAVPYEGDQRRVPDLAMGPRFVEKRADRVHDLEIGLLAVSADVVAFSDAALSEDLADRRAMILHEKPVAH